MSKSIDGINTIKEIRQYESDQRKQKLSGFKYAAKQVWYLIYGVAIVTSAAALIYLTYLNLTGKPAIVVLVAAAIILVPVLQVLGKGTYTAIVNAIKEQARR